MGGGRLTAMDYPFLEEIGEEGVGSGSRGSCSSTKYSNSVSRSGSEPGPGPWQKAQVLFHTPRFSHKDGGRTQIFFNLVLKKYNYYYLVGMLCDPPPGVG